MLWYVFTLLWNYVYVYDYVLDFPCWALGSLLSVYVQENKFRGGKIRGAWRMCIDDEWSQGVERYRFEDVVSFYVFYGFTCIFRIIV